MDVSNLKLEFYSRPARKFWTFWRIFTDVKTSVWALTETLGGNCKRERPEAAIACCAKARSMGSVVTRKLRSWVCAPEADEIFNSLMPNTVHFGLHFI